MLPELFLQAVKRQVSSKTQEGESLLLATKVSLTQAAGNLTATSGKAFGGEMEG